MSARPCPACDQVHGKGEGGFLYDSRDYPGLLHCNWCGRYYLRETPRLRSPDGGLRLIPSTELTRWERA